jgi:hypothetical protein
LISGILRKTKLFLNGTGFYRKALDALLTFFVQNESSKLLQSN